MNLKGMLTEGVAGFQYMTILETLKIFTLETAGPD